MNDLKLFSNSEFGELGVLTIEGREYFPAKAAAAMLGYKDTTNAIKQHCKGVVKHHLPTSSGMQETNLIPEGDLYRLIVRSKLPSAERFERWIFDEVLPEIRRTGGYAPELGAVIAQTVQATVGEVMRQLGPLLSGACAEPEEPLVPAKRRRFQQLDLVGRLDTALREEVEDMLLPRRYTLYQISAYLQEHHGLCISKSALGRHRAKLRPYDSEGAGLL